MAKYYQLRGEKEVRFGEMAESRNAIRNFIRKFPQIFSWGAE